MRMTLGLLCYCTASYHLINAQENLYRTDSLGLFGQSRLFIVEHNYAHPTRVCTGRVAARGGLLWGLIAPSSTPSLKCIALRI